MKESYMLEQIKSSCEFVANNSKHVSINDDEIIKLVSKIDNIELKNWLSSSPFGLLDLKVERIINFLLIFESIDFSFWGEPKWSIETDNGKLDGSIALMYCLLKYIKEKGTTDFSNITSQEFSKIVKGNIEIPLIEKRFEIAKEVSTIVNEKMNGNFFEYIHDITDDTKLFNLIVNYFPNFKDERNYKEQTIYFYKLAQLLTSDILHIREIKEGIKVNYSHLIGCADYKIPQVLRAMGILKYDKDLSMIVDNNIPIEENSEYEIEIRANMIFVICKIGKLLNNKYDYIDINDYLFMQKKNKSLKLRPYHLTRNTNY